MNRIRVTADLLDRLRAQARRRALSVSQALAVYLAAGLEAERELATASLVAHSEIDLLTDALDGRR